MKCLVLKMANRKATCVTQEDSQRKIMLFPFHFKVQTKIAKESIVFETANTAFGIRNFKVKKTDKVGLREKFCVKFKGPKH